ncbi:substrate-binding domain-containing protein [Mesorhizobium sp. VK25A]|uniref:Substrate-binding domain-containing protein n=1 Tax=Mesorhizobium vachelliae TaxID=3072309 RepID=A0ABU5A879_9HYPH|nr:MULTISPECIES: substrate-binding domain-containing protein [unclassified Mesorhizobium]MDX8533916.1 substrate-binding domain-containing protein [Mesorhizobium sp. VK25D]MDX8546613.1 substrate-binding domain-containing protein [Mesorhizobium sp. VK25A]
MTITGLGPHGERAVPADQVGLSGADADAARKRNFSVAVVLHTTASDWAKEELAGIVATLGRYGAAVVEVIDCAFDVDRQVAELQRLATEPVDAVISIPIGSARAADAHRAIAEAGKKLLLLDNAPTGMLPGKDYVSVVSTDNFGLGQIGAELLAGHVAPGGTVGVLAYGVDFFATHEREIAFRKWMATHRPDLSLVRGKFADVTQARAATAGLLQGNPDLAGLFAVWDVPAAGAIAAIRDAGKMIPITTVDLGNDVAADLAAGGLIKGIAAQLPYDQGVAVGIATILGLLERQPPPWIALPGLGVTAVNVVEAYQVVWRAPAPAALLKARKPRKTMP